MYNINTTGCRIQSATLLGRWWRSQISVSISSWFLSHTPTQSQAKGSISERKQVPPPLLVRGYGQGSLCLRTLSTFKKFEGLSHPTCHRDTSVVFQIWQLLRASCTCLPVSTSAMTLHDHWHCTSQNMKHKHEQYFWVCFFKNDVCIKSLKMKRQWLNEWN